MLDELYMCVINVAYGLTCDIHKRVDRCPGQTVHPTCDVFPDTVSIRSREMIKTVNLKSFLFVFIQFVCLGILALTGPLFASNALLFIVQITGLGLGLWAVYSMRIGNFNIIPEPFSWSRLVTSGPYRYVRHPMYMALLLVTLPLVIEDFSWFRLGVWMLLLVDLLVKMNFEENLLRDELAGYEQYTRDSFRLIPFLF